MLSLSLPNKLESLETARSALLAYLAPQALNAKVLFNLELVLEESLMNASLHAFKDAGLHLIEFSAWCDDEAVYLRFEDEGLAFDPTQAAEPVLPQSIAEAAPGGLGLMLVRKRALSVSYSRTEGRNRLTIALARR
ncbi:MULTISPECIES: ATP-binding protein [Roseateles]|uniref:ATP-binding protein n=1 Tax=Roseateles albus TaxID=2987525 RepID=A0ABT5KFG9_9BURK|nr:MULTISPECIES: ATP-binding protein [Roseateles]MCV2359729.1 ATP-binding protein [Paucibacter sp. TC2R-5]MDC8772676.1 ATP-binding protein [Roseateles albus]